MRGKKLFYITLLCLSAAIAAFLMFGADIEHSVVGYGDMAANPATVASISISTPEIPVAETIIPEVIIPENDFPAPDKVKAIYATSWSASSRSKMDYLYSVIERTEANAIVVDIKDYSGLIAYSTDDPVISKLGTEEVRIRDVGKLVADMHARGIYTIARVVVFQDPAFAAIRPDLAVKSKKTGSVWLDNKDLAWMDPSSKEVWDYNIRVAENAFSKGFDEVNFDYIRFPSDGNLSDMEFPFNGSGRTRREIMKDFFTYLRGSLEGRVISIDMFGLVTTASDDMGIGQYLEDAFGNFDFICPMVYPSHFASGFIGYTEPAAYPYEVIKYSIDQAEKRLSSFVSIDTAEIPEKTKISSKMRPWIQDFSLGYTYGKDEVSLQIKAITESSDNGWMIWSPSNNYTEAGFTENR
jgi:hypothetical protein